MRNINVIVAAICLQALGLPAHAWEQEQQQKQTTEQEQQAKANAGANAESEAEARAKGEANVGVTTKAETGDSTSSALGGTSTSTAEGAKVDTSAGNGNGANVNTTNNTKLIYINLPTTPAVAPTVTGTGSIAVTSQCGPLVRKVRKPIEYLVVGHFGIKTVTLAGQETDTLEPILTEDGKVKQFEKFDNGDGTFSEWGSIYTEAAIIVTSSVSKQFGLGLFGGSGGGNTTNGTSGTITGTERVIALGSCEYRRYKVLVVPATQAPIELGLDAPKTEVLAPTGRHVLVRKSTKPPLCNGKPIPVGYDCQFVRDRKTVVEDVGLKGSR